MSGFCKQTEIPVMVLFPSEGVSPVQKAQMVTANYEKLKVLGVQSDFDYCQSSLKQVFNDTEFTAKLQVYNKSVQCVKKIKGKMGSLFFGCKFD